MFIGTCRSFPNLFKSVEFTDYVDGDLHIMGIPYITHNIGIGAIVEEMKGLLLPTKKNILLIHCDLWGAKDPNGREVNTVENIPRNLGKFFKGFDLVLSGHIHKHEKLWENVYMVGAPYQQRKSDMGCKMGYLLIYDDLTIEFINYNAPEFKTYNKGEGKPDDFHYWIPVEKPKKREKENGKEFSTTLDKELLAKMYLKAKGIDNISKTRALINILQKTDD